jgi:hypothetical protein
VGPKPAEVVRKGVERGDFGPDFGPTPGSVETAPDAVEAAIADALTRAAAAGQWAIVAQLAGELEARRRARAEVPTLSDARARRGR